MTPKLLIINGNPKPDSLCHALAREYARSAEEGGAEVTLHHVGELAFEPDLHHGYDELQPLEPDLLAWGNPHIQGHSKVEVRRPAPDAALACSHPAPYWAAHGYKPIAIAWQIPAIHPTTQTGNAPASHISLCG